VGKTAKRLRAALFISAIVVGFVTGVGHVAAQQIDMASVRSNDELRRGVIAFYNGYYNESVLAFQKSLQYKSDNTRAHFWLGRAYYYAGFDDAALGEWRFLSDHGDSSPYLQNLIGTIAWRRGLTRENAGGTRYVMSGEVVGKVQDTTLFSRPANVVARSDGSYYVTSFATQTVDVFDVNGRRREVFRGGLEGFDGPFDVAEAANGDIYVSEYYANRIALCGPNGNKIKTFGGTGKGAGSLVGPQYLATDSGGFLYVTSWGSGIVSKFDSNGTFILSFGGSQDGFAGLQKPTGVAVMHGRVYVADQGAKQIDVFDESGNFITSIAQGMVSMPEDLSVFSPGKLLVADTTRLLVVNTDQDTVAVLSDLEGRGSRVTSAAVGANGSVISCDFNTSKIYLLSNITDLYTALFVQIDRVDASKFPTVTADVTVQDRNGNPIVGLDASNFRITENGLSVSGEPSLLFAGYSEKTPGVVLLADRSKTMQQYIRQMQDAAGGLYDALGGSKLEVVSAGKSPVIETQSGAGRASVVSAAAQNGSYASDWAFDQGVRLSGSELLKQRGKRAIVFVTQGQLGQDAFKSYGLQELTQYLENNGITFSAVLVDKKKPSAQLQYLVKNTGGEMYYLYSPTGVAEVVKDLRAKKNGSYVLQYESRHQTDFGRAYIPLEVELYVMRRTGRGEAGYYGPLKF
jgi:hypothetical protein